MSEHLLKVILGEIKVLFAAFQLNQDSINKLGTTMKEGFERIGKQINSIAEVQQQQSEILKILSSCSIEQEADISYLKRTKGILEVKLKVDSTKIKARIDFISLPCFLISYLNFSGAPGRIRSSIN